MVITGANSAVGLAIIRRSRKEASSSHVVAAVRSIRAEEQIRSRIGVLEGVVRISYDDPASMDAAFRGAASVIHLAGILVEQSNSTYEQANVESTGSVVEAARRNGIRKIVLVSAIGADENSRNRYYRTKAQGEVLVRASGLCYTVLRVPLLLGPGTAGAASLRLHVNGGATRLIDGGRYQQQPLHVDDLARAAFLAATQSSVAENATLELVGPCSLTERELVERAAQSLGRTVKIRSVPRSLLSFVLGLRGRVMGPGFSRDALEVITANTRVDPRPAIAALGFEFTGIDDMIRDSLNQGPGHE